MSTAWQGRHGAFGLTDMESLSCLPCGARTGASRTLSFGAVGSGGAALIPPPKARIGQQKWIQSYGARGALEQKVIVNVRYTVCQIA
jgi:hypothetical protein